MENTIIVDTHPDNVLDLGFCGYKSLKRPGFPEKVAWFKKQYQEGLRIKTLVSGKDGNQGMIETIPGERCWRPVRAAGYSFIHCLFVGLKAAYKGKGYASLLLDACEKEALESGRSGMAVVVRAGSFMVGKELFLKRGYQIADSAPPDFELLVKKFDPSAQDPKFNGGWEKRLKTYGKGLTIIRAFQCPYTVKNVEEILQTAENEFGLRPKIVNVETAEQAQSSPCPFGIFCIVYNGQLIADHPISARRFGNIIRNMK